MIAILLLALQAVTAAPFDEIAFEPPHHSDEQDFRIPKFLSYPKTNTSNTNETDFKVGVIWGIQSSYQGAKQSLSNAASNAYHFVQPIYMNVKDDAQQLLSTTSEAASSTVEGLTGTARGITSKVTKAAGSTVQELTGSVHGITSKVSEAADSTVEELTGTVRGITSKVTEAADSTVEELTGTVRGITSKVAAAARDTKTFVVQKTEDAEGFFSRSLASARDWFTNLEDEMKEFLHFALRVIEVIAVVVILMIFLWILKRVMAGYRFIQGIAESFELQERQQTV